MEKVKWRFSLPTYIHAKQFQGNRHNFLMKLGDGIVVVVLLEMSELPDLKYLED